MRLSGTEKLIAGIVAIVIAYGFAPEYSAPVVQWLKGLDGTAALVLALMAAGLLLALMIRIPRITFAGLLALAAVPYLWVLLPLAQGTAKFIAMIYAMLPSMG
jgi:hypothetical protein